MGADELFIVAGGIVLVGVVFILGWYIGYDAGYKERP